jgi:hypothetical protein
MNSEKCEDLQPEDKKLRSVSRNFSGNWFTLGIVGRTSENKKEKRKEIQNRKRTEEEIEIV